MSCPVSPWPHPDLDKPGQGHCIYRLDRLSLPGQGQSITDLISGVPVGIKLQYSKFVMVHELL